MTIDRPILEALPSPELVRDRLGDALREVELLRRLLKLSERAAEYRQCDQRRREQEGGPRVT
jgi:hypothetical protein